jgi:GNAT superfamily N-acetyltransferase
MRVVEATDSDFDAFIALAAQVEEWFGAMVDDPGFHQAIRKNIDRRSALIARNSDDDAIGGLLFSHRHAPDYAIGWLVVAEASRSAGVGRAMLAEALRRWVRPPATVSVVTFGADHPAARSRRFYERLGFEPAEIVADGPEGGSRQRFRLALAAVPDWAR